MAFGDKVIEMKEHARIAQTLTNEELTEQLLNKVWLGLDIYGRESALVGEAIERLGGVDHIKKKKEEAV